MISLIKQRLVNYLLGHLIGELQYPLTVRMEFVILLAAEEHRCLSKRWWQEIFIPFSVDKHGAERSSRYRDVKLSRWKRFKRIS